jgi:hypothetical protein
VGLDLSTEPDNDAFGIIYSLLASFLLAIVSVVRTSIKGVRMRYTAILGGIFAILYLFEYNRVANALGFHFHAW